MHVFCFKVHTINIIIFKNDFNKEIDQQFYCTTDTCSHHSDDWIFGLCHIARVYIFLFLPDTHIIIGALPKHQICFGHNAIGIVRIPMVFGRLQYT
jgi:hypothetical protein